MFSKIKNIDKFFCTECTQLCGECKNCSAYKYAKERKKEYLISLQKNALNFRGK